MELHSIAEILTDLRAGRMVLIMDDEDRENEGDLVMVAEKVRPEDVNFMARFGRGLICLTLTADRCRQLRLPLMVSSTQREHRTNFLPALVSHLAQASIGGDVDVQRSADDVHRGKIGAGAGFVEAVDYNEMKRVTGFAKRHAAIVAISPQ
mgnify:CR=1 FL=1